MYSFAGGGLAAEYRHHGDRSVRQPDHLAGSSPKSSTTKCTPSCRSGLGVRDAPQERADALVHGTIVSYDADIPVGFSANPQQAVTARRHLQVTIEVEIIDQSNGHVLYQNKSLREEADYAERAEGDGRKQAIAKLVQKHHRGGAEQLVNHRRGASALGCLFSLLIVAAVGYFGVNVGACTGVSTSTRTTCSQEARFAGQRTNDQILTRLQAAADSLGLPEGASKDLDSSDRQRRSPIEADYYETRRDADVRARGPFPSARRRHRFERARRSARQSHELGARAERGARLFAGGSSSRMACSISCIPVTSTCLLGARRAGDALVVGVNSDESVRRLKGPERPIRGAPERCYVLAALRVVDAVVVFDEDTPLELIHAAPSRRAGEGRRLYRSVDRRRRAKFADGAGRSSSFRSRRGIPRHPPSQRLRGH